MTSPPEKTMKKLQMFAASVSLILLLSASTFGDDGIMSTGKTPPPPPPPASSTAQSDSADTDGIISTGAPSADTLAEVAAGVLQSVLALF
jgi:hypothetical protein